MPSEEVPGRSRPVREPNQPTSPDKPIREPLPGRPPAEEPPKKPPAEDPPKPEDPKPIKAAPGDIDRAGGLGAIG